MIEIEAMILGKMHEDVRTVFKRDPAARNALEVLICYPGLHALWLHRVAHALWVRGLKLVARILSHLGRFLSGIEIHPGATIGRRVFIDHGMGVVIGETAEVGDDVLMYQGVVLGGTTLEKKKRHPTLGNGVVVGAGSILLGAIAVGAGAKVGAGSVVLSDVEPGTVVVGVPARATSKRKPGAEGDLDHARLPDPVASAIRTVLAQNAELRERVKKLETMRGEVTEEIDRKIEEQCAEIVRMFPEKNREADRENGEGI